MNEQSTKAKILAHWETLVQAGTPEAVAELEEQGIKGFAPADAKIAALDCLRRIGTTEAVNAISGYLLCDWVSDFSARVQQNVTAHQFEALMRVEKEESRARVFKLIEFYERRTFNDEDYMYSAPQMYADIETALGMANSRFADSIAIELAERRPDFTGIARAYLMTREPVDIDAIQKMDAVMRGQAANNLEWKQGEPAESYARRLVRDVAPFIPVETMDVLCKIPLGYDSDRKGQPAVYQGVHTLLKTYPEHQKSLILAVIKSKSYEAALYEFVQEQDNTPNEHQVRMDMIDAYVAGSTAYKIHHLMAGLLKDSPVVDYGLRALVTMGDYPYNVRGLVRENFPEKAVDVMRLYLEQAAQRSSSYTSARDMANMGTRSDRDEFIAHCIANPSYDSIRQIRHLGIEDTVVARVLLEVFDHPTAVKEVGQMAKFCPDIAIKALLDAREARLQSGDHSVWVHEDVIRTAVAGMATPKRLHELAAGENRIVLQTIFDRVAQSAIIDARAAFGAAVGLLQAERAHEQAIGKLAAACGLVTREVK